MDRLDEEEENKQKTGLALVSHGGGPGSYGKRGRRIYSPRTSDRSARGATFPPRESNGRRAWSSRRVPSPPGTWWLWTGQRWTGRLGLWGSGTWRVPSNWRAFFRRPTRCGVASAADVWCSRPSPSVGKGANATRSSRTPCFPSASRPEEKPRSPCVRISSTLVLIGASIDLLLDDLLIADAEISLRFERLDEREQKVFVANELLELHHGRIVIGPRSRQSSL